MADATHNDIPPGPTAVVALGTVIRQVPGSRYAKRIRVTGSGSYPTGGYVITPAQCGFNEQIDYCDITNEHPGTTASYWLWNTVTQKLQLIVTATGNELGAAQNDGTAFADCTFSGY